jgi:hypothetical protein
MTAFATTDNLLSVDPTIQDFGVLDWDTELARSQTEIIRVLSVRWWPTFRKRYALSDIDLINSALLDPTQWTQATVYHALAYHISPKLSKFEPEADRFQEMMKYYQGRFEHEMDLCIREGVRYDVNEDDVFSASEKASDTSLRLRR